MNENVFCPVASKEFMITDIIYVGKKNFPAIIRVDGLGGDSQNPRDKIVAQFCGTVEDLGRNLYINIAKKTIIGTYVQVRLDDDTDVTITYAGLKETDLSACDHIDVGDCIGYAFCENPIIRRERGLHIIPRIRGRMIDACAYFNITRGIGQKYTIGNKPPLEKMRDMLRLSENEYDSLARLKHIDTIAAKCVMKIEELERIK